MKLRHLLAAGLGALALVGCEDEGPTFVETAPKAYVRYVNASPDSPALTVRFIDVVENWRTADSLAFRRNTGYYQAITAGNKQLRAWRNLGVAGNAQLDTGTVLVLDTTFALAPQTYYTIVQTGLVMPGRGQATHTARVNVFTDTVPSTVAATNVAVRVYHAAPGAPAVDVAAADTVTGSTSSGSIANVAPLTRSGYVNLPVLGATGLYRYTVRATGTTTTLATSVATAFPGLPAVAASPTSPQLEAVAGPRIGRSALALVVFPAAVTGSPAFTQAFSTPGIDVFPDNKP